MCYVMFFLLDSLVVRILCLKKCLTTLRMVMNVTYICSERLPKCLFKDDTRTGDSIYAVYALPGWGCMYGLDL